MLHLLFPTKERFAKAFISALTKAGVQVLSYDPQTFGIKTKSHGEIWLHNFHSEFSRLSLLKRRSYLRDYIDTQIVNRRELSKDWAIDGQFILPTVKHKIAFDQLALRAELDSGKPQIPSPHIRRLGSSLYQMLCFDYPNMMMFSLDYDPQAEHKVTPKQALDAAISNLWNKSKDDWQQPIPGTWLSPWQDNQDAARLALPGLIRQLKVKGDPVALTVHRDMLFITGSQDPTGIQAVLQVATEQLQVPRALRAPMLLLTPDDQWVDFQPPTADPAYQPVTFWNDIALAAHYHEMHELIVRVIKHRGEDTTVVPVQVMHDKEADRDFVIATWDASNPGLLPVAPIIGFVQAGQLIGFAGWGQALTHAGHLLKKVDIQPDYWRILGFPDDATLVKMNVSLDVEPWDVPRVTPPSVP